MIKIRVQFFDHPTDSYTVSKINERKGERHKELDVWTSSCRYAIQQFFGKYYPKQPEIFIDKVGGNTFAVYFKKPAHFSN
jgi:hypothetical protein